MRSRLWSKGLCQILGCWDFAWPAEPDERAASWALPAQLLLLASFEHDPLTPLLPLIQLNGTGGVAMPLCPSSHISLPIALTAILRWDDTLQEEATNSSPFCRMVVPACLKGKAAQDTPLALQGSNLTG